MKKLLLLLLCMVMLLPLSGCAKEYVFNEEKALDLNYHSKENLLRGVPIDMALDYFYDTYPEKGTYVYVPVSGEYETKSGEKFKAVVLDTCIVAFVEDASHSRLLFTIRIYDEDGNLIVEKHRFCSYVQVGTKKPDLTYVSEEFREYWEIIAVRCDKLEHAD